MAVLLGTIRGAGIYGDQNDATNWQGGAFSGTVYSPLTVLADLAEAPDGIQRVDFYARAAVSMSGFGPADPTINLRWRIGTSTPEAFSDPLSVFTGAGYQQIPTDAGAVSAILQPNGQPWTLAAVNDLRMRVSFRCDDLGSGEETFVEVSELWAEVWGNDPPPPVSPQQSETITLSCATDRALSLSCTAGGQLTLRCPVDEEV